MASQDLSSTGLEGCLPASGNNAFHDWFLFYALFLIFQCFTKNGTLNLGFH